MVFPKYPDGVLYWLEAGDASVIETEMQVSELVTGFTEQRGPNKETYAYGHESPYYQRNLNRFFRTTGVCLRLPGMVLSNESLQILVEAFCEEFGVQQRDIGVGEFYAKVNATGRAETQKGACIFDAANGSLRLTQQLAENFSTAARLAVDLAKRRSNPTAHGQLLALLTIAESLKPKAQRPRSVDLFQTDGEWWEVISAGEKGVCSGDGGSKEEVEIIRFRYTPNGAVYDIKVDAPNLKRSLGIQSVQPIFGQSKTCLWNPTTGEVKSNT
jgi:hypothetical protein